MKIFKFFLSSLLTIMLVFLTMAYTRSTESNFKIENEISTVSDIDVIQSTIPDNTESNTDIVRDDFKIQVDKSKVIISDEVELPDYLPPIPPNSYAITQTQTYEKWKRIYAVYYPRFTDEIKYAGSEIIKNYYTELAQSETEHGYWEMEDTVFDSVLEYHKYYCKTYEVGFYDTYLSVLYFSTWFGGGVHSRELCLVDNFDMESGRILTLEDLFGEEEIYYPILNKAICKRLLEQDIPTFMKIEENIDIISYSFDLQFRICETGIEFIFQEYEIASYAAGIIFITVPYQDLESILVINIK